MGLSVSCDAGATARLELTAKNAKNAKRSEFGPGLAAFLGDLAVKLDSAGSRARGYRWVMTAEAGAS
jgi:hypothetical protein